MTTADILAALEASPLAHAISKSNHLVGAALQIAHVLGFIALLAAILLGALRLLRLTLTDQPLEPLVASANRLFVAGLVLTLSSGALMFIATPALYFYKPVFGLKILLFVAALALQFGAVRRLTERQMHPLGVRVLVGVSLGAWFAVGFAGRMIGFT